MSSAIYFEGSLEKQLENPALALGILLPEGQLSFPSASLSPTASSGSVAWLAELETQGSCYDGVSPYGVSALCTFFQSVRSPGVSLHSEADGSRVPLRTSICQPAPPSPHS